jgi:GTP 3',8-cyclase
VSSLIQLAPLTPVLGAPPLQGPLVDTFHRVHDNLRISVTDRCNIRCFYCMPEEGGTFSPVSTLLTFDEIVRFASLAVRLGVRKIRLTGGEPLLRPRLPELIGRLTAIPGLQDLALTTNGVLLSRFAKPMHDAGLRRLNVHLDSLDSGRFERITRRNDLSRVLAGIETAIGAGYSSIKLNAVAIRDVNEPDIVPLARYARERGLEIRYIEFMPLDAQNLWSRSRVLLADEMVEMLSSEICPLVPIAHTDPRAPAVEYEYTDGRGRVGFIASVSRPFCLDCNRLRLTSDGKLRYCLFANEETDVKRLLADRADQAELEAAIRSTVWRKWKGHEINSPLFTAPDRPMYSIGG